MPDVTGIQDSESGTAQWMFTPDDTYNYTGLEGTAEYVVVKATPVVEAPVVDSITYNSQTSLGSVKLNGGSASSVVGGSTVTVAGIWNWKDASVVPFVGNGGFTAVFTPDDTTRYNPVERTVAVPVVQADNAPDMPSAAMSVPRSSKKVGDVELPAGWQWKDTDREIILGETPIGAEAVYTGMDSFNYKNISVSVIITRQKCTHSETVIQNAIVAGCETDGYTGDVFCTDCGTMLSLGTVIAASGHDWIVTIVKEATTTSEGKRIFMCSKCGDSYEEVIPKLPNTHTHIWTAAWCSDSQNHWHECSCGLRSEEAAHIYGEWNIIKQPTAESEGVQERSCTVCGYAQTEAIPKKADDDKKPDDDRKPDDGQNPDIQQPDSSNQTYDNKQSDGNTIPDNSGADNKNEHIDEIDKDKNGLNDNFKVSKSAIELSSGLKIKQTGRNITVTWEKVSGADGYDIYIQYCGKKFGAGSRTCVKSGKKTSTTISKVNGKTLNPKKYYKIYVAAYKMKNGKKITIAKSLTFHVAGSKNKIYTNVKSVKVKKNSYTVKKGSAIRIKPKRFRYDREKQLSAKHTKPYRFLSSNRRIAAVSSNGKIKAKRSGVCEIYVFATNGRNKKIKVRVR